MLLLIWGALPSPQARVKVVSGVLKTVAVVMHREREVFVCCLLLSDLVDWWQPLLHLLRQVWTVDFLQGSTCDGFRYFLDHTNVSELALKPVLTLLTNSVPPCGHPG